MMPAVQADIFQLASGGRLTGRLVERSPAGEYRIETAAGATVTLSRRQVVRVVRQDAIDVEYVARSRAQPDTAEAHRQLAQWCQEHKLSPEAEHHFRRLLELDPTDAEARLELGYQQHQGRWMTRDEIMAQRGLRFYQGTYRTPQDILLREQHAAREEAEANWFRKIRTWLGWLDDSRRRKQAVAEISAVRDPHAATSIVRLLQRSDNEPARKLLLATLAKLDHPVAVTTLVALSLHDPDHEVRLTCLDYLLARGHPLRITPYVDALDPRRQNNEIINRAAEALQILGNPAAISPLIQALVTTHKYQNNDAPPGEMGASFSRDGRGGGLGGGGGLSLGGGPRVRRVDHKNMAVRQALSSLTGGQDFEFDETAWRRWYVNEQIQDYVDTRRDQ